MMKQHGGKREGAGRKPVPSPLQPITVRLSADDIEYLRRIDANLGKALRQLIAQVKAAP